jgi:antitoxin (DNA-binding transcriptional repressor) of toxin-antitoxin stability system
MKTIGVRELKATLSERLKEVRKGEVYLVTDRGTVVAELRSPGTSAPADADVFDRRILPWIEAGRAIAGQRNRADLYPSAPIGCEEGTAQALIDELRAEGE